MESTLVVVLIHLDAMQKSNKVILSLIQKDVIQGT